MSTVISISMLMSFIALIVGLIKPELVIMKGWKGKKSRGSVVLIYGALMLVLAAFYPTTSVVPPKYVVLNKSIVDTPIKTQVKYDILVKGKMDQDNLELLLQNLYSSIKKTTDSKYHDYPTNVYIYAFTSKESYKSGVGRWIAMLGKNYDDKNPDISINTVQLKYLHSKPIVKFGLTETKRKKIYFESEKAIAKASKEAIDAFSPWGLKPNRKIKLTKRTPLMPELNPSNPLEAMSKIIYLPADYEIKVIKVAKKGKSLYPWYYVNATAPSGESYYGWINSAALIGQIKSNPEKQEKYRKSLVKKYEENIANKYGLNLNEIKKIEEEGTIKWW